jgi:hypothetical protein
VTDPRPTASLYDTDGTFLTDLPLAAGIQWQDETSAPGALSLRLPLDDAATAQATSRRILKVYWRGAFRQAARIDSSSTDVAVDGRMWREWSNLPGLLSILGGVPVYPEYGLDRTSSGTRTFGYMSRYGHGAWLDSGNWTPAIGVRWSDMTGPRAGLPAGLDFPNPKWISKRGPMSDEPAFSHQWFRKMFDTTSQMTVQILATGDNFLDLWLDGEHIVESSSQNAFTWRDAFQVSQILPPSPVGGRHTIAARIRNNRDAANIPNRMGFLFTMQEVDASGNVIEQPPIINSDEDWIVSDVAPGFRRAEVVTRVWSESNLYEYAATGLINLGFSITHDTDGNLWEDAPAEYTVDVGSSVLDALATFTEKDIDAAIDPDTLRLHMWNRRGADKTGTVRLGLGRDGGNLLAHRVERVEPQYNTILMQLKDGRWVQRQTLAAVTANGREATGLSVGSTSDTGSANQVADAQLADLALPTVTFTSQVSSLTGPQMYVDYDLGDTINVPDENGAGYYAARVMAVTVDASSDGPVQVTPELMLDRSATPMVIDTGGPGTGDPGDVENPPGSGGGGGGGSTDPISGGGGTDVAYDWTALGYGTAYDAAGGAGGYIPDDTHAGVPAGSTYAQTMTPTGGMLTITASPAAKGVGTASASTNTVTLTGHGMPNGHPDLLLRAQQRRVGSVGRRRELGGRRQRDVRHVPGEAAQRGHRPVHLRRHRPRLLVSDGDGRDVVRPRRLRLLHHRRLVLDRAGAVYPLPPPRPGDGVGDQRVGGAGHDLQPVQRLRPRRRSGHRPGRPSREARRPVRQELPGVAGEVAPRHRRSRLARQQRAVRPLRDRRGVVLPGPGAHERDALRSGDAGVRRRQAPHRRRPHRGADRRVGVDHVEPDVVPGPGDDEQRPPGQPLGRAVRADEHPVGQGAARRRRVHDQRRWCGDAAEPRTGQRPVQAQQHVPCDVGHRGAVAGREVGRRHPLRHVRMRLRR